jgi:hypothetical protein
VHIICTATEPPIKSARSRSLCCLDLTGSVVAWLFVGSDSATRIVWSDLDPLFLGSFVLSYLGAPPGYFSSRLAPVFGFIGFVAAILLTLRARNLDPGTVARLCPFYGLMSFAVGCAVLSALGRAEFSLDQGRSPRYLIVSQLYWVGLFAPAAAAAGATANSVMSTRAGLRRTVNIAAAMAIGLTFYNSQKIAKRQAVEATRLNDVIADIRNRYPDVAPGTYELLAYPDKCRARELLAIMHHYQVNLFSN